MNILSPKIKRIEIIPIYSQRATTLNEIEKAAKKVGISYDYYEDRIDEEEEYLVFGSFYVAEEFLNRMQEKNNVPK